MSSINILAVGFFIDKSGNVRITLNKGHFAHATYEYHFYIVK